MGKFPCPVCGDPSAFPFWIDEEPPAGCPNDEAWIEGRAPQIKNVTECRFQMSRAKTASALRRLSPDCFDRAGNMKPGRSAEAWGAYARANAPTPPGSE